MTEWKTYLRLLRQHHGLKQAVVAEMLNVDQGTISRWERGVSEPDLSRRKRLRDLIWKYSTRLECDINRLMASPFGGKSLVTWDNIMVAIAQSPNEALLYDKSDVIGRDVRWLRGDSAYNALWEDHLSEYQKGEFAGISSLFFSQKSGHWTETYAIPVVVGGSLHFLAERRLLDHQDDLEAHLRVIPI